MEPKDAVLPSEFTGSYAQVEFLNKMLVDELDRNEVEYCEVKRRRDLERFPSIRAVMVAFSNLPGRLHFLDYDKHHLLSNADNLTFDGSSISGFTAQKESDLRFELDWSSFRFLPAPLFGSGKVLMFANIKNQDGSYFANDFRNRLALYENELFRMNGSVPYIAPELEGFVFKGLDAEQVYSEDAGFELLTLGGYFATLPQDELRKFIDICAQAQRALGFRNEKDHPEVASSQFEINFKYDTPVRTADRVLLYKLVCRQAAALIGCTACFLPKPIVDMNGSGSHTNMSLNKDGKNLFFGGSSALLSEMGRDFAAGILFRARELCLVFTSSVNAFRRLDPAMEAPNEIKMSDCDRGSMIRIPIGNEKSARVECRVVAPDANPYLTYFALLHAGMSCVTADEATKRAMRDVLLPQPDGSFPKLPSDMYTALDHFEGSAFLREVLGVGSHAMFAKLKRNDAGRCPAQLGHTIKNTEVRLHHEVSNQFLRERF